MKYLSPSFILFLLFLSWGKSHSQSLPIGNSLLEEHWRRKQVQGKINSDLSFTVRPLHSTEKVTLDSLYEGSMIFPHKQLLQKSFLKNKKGIVGVLPVSFVQQFNSRHPYGQNDGSMIAANGYQNQLSFGFFTKTGPLTIQLRPEIIVAQNAGYRTFPTEHSDATWKAYYATVLDRIDNPERYGNGTYTQLLPGQSSIRLSYKKLSIGLSTENLWWGPGVRNSLLMSNNAPGFPHLTFNTVAPLQTPIGSFEGQMISGLLKNSGYLPIDTNRKYNGQLLYTRKPSGDRYLNGLVITWQPKWTKGLYLGLSRVFYLYKKDIEPSLNGYLPVIGQILKGNLNEATTEDALNRDQMFSLFFRLILPKEKAEFYGELGRNDHSGDLRDLFLEPEHSRAYIFGFRKLFETGKKDKEIELTAEVTNLQIPMTILLREQSSWYAHYQVQDGYTHKGQVIGAGIGPGGNSQTIAVNVIKGIHKTGVQLERVIHNNDFYYTAFSLERDYWRHWVDLSVQVNKSFQYKGLLFDARVAWVKSLNYQWVREFDAQNIHSSLSVLYPF